MRKQFNKPQAVKIEFKTNEQIKFPEVRVNTTEGSTIMKISEAIKKAKETDEDLILINDNATPPVTVIMDYGKYLYKLKKAETDRKKASTQTETKEIRISLNIGEHDLGVKIRKIEEFISDGDRVKITMLLKGRENATPQKGEIVMLKLAQTLEDKAILEALPKFEGKRWSMTFKPKKKK